MSDATKQWREGLAAIMAAHLAARMKGDDSMIVVQDGDSVIIFRKGGDHTVIVVNDAELRVG
jgi:hypothetical protein